MYVLVLTKGYNLYKFIKFTSNTGDMFSSAMLFIFILNLTSRYYIQL